MGRYIADDNILSVFDHCIKHYIYTLFKEKIRVGVLITAVFNYQYYIIRTGITDQS